MSDVEAGLLPTAEIWYGTALLTCVPRSPAQELIFVRERDRLTLDTIGDDLSTLILEKKHAMRSGFAGVSDADARIRSVLVTFKDGIGRLEQSLSRAEDSGARSIAELRKWEETLLQLSQKYDRLELMARGENADLAMARQALLGGRSGPKAVRFVDPVHEQADQEDAGSSLLLQRRLMDDQDSQLDELSATIGRQKQIGLLINDELELHVDLLEETEQHVDSTQQRLEAAGRRLERVLFHSAKNAK
ncbi:hypothetical protein HKX48_003913, partial [Thoreauomyces humboldtii]